MYGNVLIEPAALEKEDEWAHFTVADHFPGHKSNNEWPNNQSKCKDNVQERASRREREEKIEGDV